MLEVFNSNICDKTILCCKFLIPTYVGSYFNFSFLGLSWEKFFIVISLWGFLKGEVIKMMMVIN